MTCMMLKWGTSDSGATVIIKCDMDFSLYPLDVQTCYVDFSSYKYTVSDMHFRWRDDPPLNFPRDSGDIYRLPRYVVSFATEKVNRTIYYGEGNHSAARMIITLSREIRSHLVESYLPSTLFVIMSWGSFVVMPEIIVPGRLVLLVTTLLSLVTMFDTIRNNSPSALELKCIEVWLISCTCFVFLAMLEYFIVLFGIRYDKHWRHKHRDLDHLADHNIEGGGQYLGKQMEVLISLFINRVSAVEESKEVSLALFPLCFVLFATIYWVSYLNASKMKKEMQATVIIKCDMDFSLYPLDVQTCYVDFSSCNHSAARMIITLSREIRSHLVESYLPSTLFVIMSWGSFVVMPEIVPGRMVLLVTTLLSLVTMFDTIRVSRTAQYFQALRACLAAWGRKLVLRSHEAVIQKGQCLQK
ncbi:glycine receptor subunit alpha-3-like [Diaphorina citri]|uniref:Glycine receptor subunit alpha-3-like n=1 Tax=Diaphorina citri TaxID=121845 RepID=A0A3Q0JDL6_DIACI|nr:glycine receptor subunit alpha-3-like [Diaphorina citri]